MSDWPAAQSPFGQSKAEPPTQPIQVSDGESCRRCGGMMVRTGSCYTCQSCGENTGCG